MSDKTEQPSLFSDPTDRNLSLATDVSPEGVARGAREYNPNLSKERSKAGIDQGHGLIELPHASGMDEVTERAIKVSRSRYPSGFGIGPVPGESEGESTPAGHEPNKPISKDVTELGLKYAARGRAALRLIKNE